MKANLAMRQRIEARANQPRPKFIDRPAFSATVRQADAIGACQVVNRYRCHGPVVRQAIAACSFMGSGSVPALAAAVVLSGLVMAVAS